ncbi:glycerol-3-phosphate 1-O-acyltransferase PlsY [Kangiella spongicola]|uniref:Glycerol-3-phosphate acyltransferase n=1 Tax=Kangiella spongicola TaxID=796379 RepID=A0A318D3L6_9GAMM|nr:glycerol-3-phosphate 1-O-acyltransferase PlsY [Kangiella spongicola]PXF63906.1 acyl-phosphate glycerol 3-phosphate acyltransferase [Kangiella spongicola]
MDWSVVGLWILAYLTGSISSAVIVCRVMQLPDPRNFGSNNPGATNVLRLGGKKAALFTLLGDMLKAIIPILIGYALDLHNRNLGWVGFMAFIGHLYPLYFNFKGGKGMATYFGALVALSPLLLGFCVVTWVVTAFFSRYSSLASLLSSFAVAAFGFYMDHRYFFPLFAMFLILTWRHRQNIKNLWHGTERKITDNKKHPKEKAPKTNP